jgi:hypothetical protein
LTRLGWHLTIEASFCVSRMITKSDLRRFFVAVVIPSIPMSRGIRAFVAVGDKLREHL